VESKENRIQQSVIEITSLPREITQCYLSLGTGEFLAVTPEKAGTQFSDPGRMQGWVVVISQ